MISFWYCSLDHHAKLTGRNLGTPNSSFCFASLQVTGCMIQCYSDLCSRPACCPRFILGGHAVEPRQTARGCASRLINRNARKSYNNRPTFTRYTIRCFCLCLQLNNTLNISSQSYILHLTTYVHTCCSYFLSFYIYSIFVTGKLSLHFKRPIVSQYDLFW